MRRPSRLTLTLCRRQWRAVARGFTLLEMLVVLTIIGLGIGVAGPRTLTTYQSIMFAMERESFEQALADLPYRAFKTHRDLVLGGRTEAAFGARSLRSGPSQFETWTGLESVQLEVPVSWKIDVPQPIVYRASGFCNGGTVSVTVGDFSERYLLQPPLCRPQIDRRDQR